MREQAFLFGEHRTLVAVVTEPAANGGLKAPPGGVLFLNAGVIHRVGPSRLYVHLARALAEAGWLSVRLDHSGIGDSPVRRDGQSFDQSAIAEAREVMDALEQSRGLRRFVLIGLCSGAVTSFDAARVDDRVAAIVMINPQGFDENAAWNDYIQNRGHARKYWKESLFSVKSWWNAVTGRIHYRRLVTVLWRQATASVQSDRIVAPVATRVGADLRTLIQRRVRTLLVCCEGDDGIEYMNVILGEDIRKLPPSPELTVAIVTGADHSLTLRDSQRRVVDAIRTWASSLDSLPPRAAEASGALKPVPARNAVGLAMSSH
jgi:pimeloyl-ACP methyl ester carboxylesterase